MTSKTDCKLVTGRNTISYISSFRAGRPFVVLLALLFFLVSYVGRAQSTDGVLRLTLGEAVELSRKNNFTNRISEREVEIAQQKFRKSNALFLPSISIEQSLMSTDNPLNVFGFLLRQENVTTADFDPAFLNDPEQRENFSTSVNIQQPLINPAKMVGRSALKDRLKASRQISERTQNVTDFRVKQTYYQLVLSKRKAAIVDTALTAAQANREQAKDFFEQGVITKADYLAAEVRLKQLMSKKSEADNEKRLSEIQLRYLLGLEDSVRVQPVDKLEMMQVHAGEVNYEMVNNTRSDMKALGYQIDATRKSLTASKLNFTPSLNLFGSYEWNDESLYRFGASNYLIGATLKWNLFSGFKNVSSLRQSKAELEKAKLTYRDRSLQNRVEIETALRNLQDARTQVELAKTSVEQSEESYRIRFDRYRQGMENISDLLSAEAMLAETKLQHAAAVYRYNVQALKLELLLEQDIAH